MELVLSKYNKMYISFKVNNYSNRNKLVKSKLLFRFCLLGFNENIVFHMSPFKNSVTKSIRAAMCFGSLMIKPGLSALSQAV